MLRPHTLLVYHTSVRPKHYIFYIIYIFIYIYLYYLLIYKMYMIIIYYLFIYLFILPYITMIFCNLHYIQTRSDNAMQLLATLYSSAILYTRPWRYIYLGTSRLSKYVVLDILAIDLPTVLYILRVES